MSNSEKRRRDAVIPRIRCTQEEKDIIKMKADECGLSLPEFMRRCALERRIIPRTDNDFLQELMRLGRMQKHLFVEGKRTGDKAYADVLVAITRLADTLRNQLMED
ncbi:hypothetical protein EIL26_17050 [Salmonella enterica subsp. enterica serovar Newport]|nr:hypothetical protein [Salmonella enterica]EAW1322213.1 hypothetical protein [Salmonella enterica subsp. diarizonae]EBW5028828.1 hypothetical protein [Salmonella enterica subsp. enterica serovar Enteritidis]EBW7256047.1 hypothetical protein [Salmonella enterica subsp. enterica serovar Gatow]ECA0403558.1 hypothetical protein [Salmonella enterica subsp. enterica serovar Newport]ECC9077097.1 hypothetical protein [Salmonella enterica subsp. enterica]EDQ7858115.1 hypothetical protein [Salmonella